MYLKRLISSFKIRTSSDRLSKHKFHDMVAPRLLATELLKKRKEDKSRTKNTTLNRADIQVLGSSGQGLSPSLLVNSEGNAYLFNCAEGTQRNCYANRVRLSNLEHLFVTRLHWPAVSGAYGLSLTLQDVGMPSFTIHSTEGILNFFKSAEYFMSFTTGIDCTTEDCSSLEFNDDKLKVKCIPLDDGVKENDPDNDGKPSKRFKKLSALVAYHCFLPDLPGSLDPVKCRELGVPVGPILAKLKSGCDITLENGNVVKSSDVCGPKSIGPNFIVIDCPTIQDIEYVIHNSELKRVQKLRSNNNQQQVDLVIHFSPEEVTAYEKYKQWMNSFSEQCKHIMLVNSQSRRVNFLDSYRLQCLLRNIEPEIFPELYLSEELSHLVKEEIKIDSDRLAEKEYPDADETDLKTTIKGNLTDQDKVIYASSFDRFNLRPNTFYEFVEPKMSLDSVLRIARLEVDFDLEMTNYRKATKNLSSPQAHEPEVVFLGTGSALPSKYRNTSCILVNLNSPRKASMILDCGEDSYGQILRHFGPDRAEEVLKELKMIYVSHHHADHHIGLIELLRRRKQLKVNGILQLLLPPGIKTHLDYYNDTFEDLSDTYSINCTKELKSRSATDIQSRPAVRRLCDSLDGLLKNISIVGVEHCANACAVVLDIDIRRPGMDSFRLAYSGDARPSFEFAKIGEESDLLIHEATFAHKEVAAANEKKHSTTSEAIDLAKMMKAKFTILTHFSQKYPKIPYFTDKFDETIGFAFDNMAIRCPSQLPRLPMMKDLLSVVFAKSLNEIDARHIKVESKQRVRRSID